MFCNFLIEVVIQVETVITKVKQGKYPEETFLPKHSEARGYGPTEKLNLHF